MPNDHDVEPGAVRAVNRAPATTGHRWLDALQILLRTRRELGRDNVSLVSAGLAQYALLAAFPALTAIVSIFGLFASPAHIAEQLNTLSGVLPPAAARILRTQLGDLSHRNTQLSIGAAAGFLLALWSTRRGIVALITAMNIAYDVRESRGFFRKLLVSMTLTIGAVVGFVLLLLLGVAVPFAIAALTRNPIISYFVAAVRWGLLWCAVVLGLALIYRFAPHRTNAPWRWITWGSATSATLWLVGGILFTEYVTHFAHYNATYGALGGVVVLLLWFYLSAYVVILGAELNSQIERQQRINARAARPHPPGPPSPPSTQDAPSATPVGPPNPPDTESRGSFQRYPH